MRSHVSVVALVLAAGCGSRNGSAIDATVTPQQCEMTFDMAFTRPCSVPADCVLFTHADCCHEIDIGVSRANLAAAMAAETPFNACIAKACGGRGCGGATSAEDGKVPGQGQSIVPTCVNQVCTSTVQ